ncbi:MAG: TrmH family RNA methyltransferase [Geminicoccaceae bacterium]|nr:TrmH family RNA methyltransferase [Geminicoccaceae bacterium]
MTNLSQDQTQDSRPGLALFEPEIATNVAALIRLAACLAVPLHLIEPLGFVMDDRRLRRVAMDYLDRVVLVRHDSFRAFNDWRADAGRRLVVLAGDAPTSHLETVFRRDDLLLAGRESDGLPPDVRAAADLAASVPLAPGNRSLNVVVACTLVLGEALRQTGAFPDRSPPHPAWPRRG